VESQIKTEIAEGRYVISHSKPPIVSALGAVRKDSGKVRIIHDASRPAGQAMNDFSPLQLRQRFQSVKDAADLVTPGCFLAKVDLHSAYRSVRVNPSNFPGTGLQWTFEGDDRPTYMVDTRLPFGSRRAPSIFHRLTQAVRRMMAKRGFSSLVVYLDDFLIIAPTYEECLHALLTLLGLLRTLGFAIAWHKVDGPHNDIIFLGININSLSMSLELPSHKLSDFRTLLLYFSTRKRASLRQLQSLAGKLNWASQVVKGGRTFLRQILDMLIPLKHKSHKVLLSTQFHDDVMWWLSFLDTFNGKSCLPHEAPTFHVLTDASSEGAGFACGLDWGYASWRADIPDLKDAHINVKEVVAIVLATARWAASWQGSKVLVHTDNVVAKHAINTGTSRSPAVMHWLRALFWLTAWFDIELEAVHVPGRFHLLPDCISRLHEPGQFAFLQSLLGVAPWAAPSQGLCLHMSLCSLCYLF